MVIVIEWEDCVIAELTSVLVVRFQTTFGVVGPSLLGLLYGEI